MRKQGTHWGKKHVYNKIIILLDLEKQELFFLNVFLLSYSFREAEQIFPSKCIRFYTNLHQNKHLSFLPFSILLTLFCWEKIIIKKEKTYTTLQMAAIIFGHYLNHLWTHWSFEGDRSKTDRVNVSCCCVIKFCRPNCIVLYWEVCLIFRWPNLY